MEEARVRKEEYPGLDSDGEPSVNAHGYHTKEEGRTDLVPFQGT